MRWVWIGVGEGDIGGGFEGETGGEGERERERERGGVDGGWDGVWIGIGDVWSVDVGGRIVVVVVGGGGMVWWCECGVWWWRRGGVVVWVGERRVRRVVGVVGIIVCGCGCVGDGFEFGDGVCDVFE